jgi:formylglycine-generating enzyme required for sulfatase activity/outer membrane protein assembly factor BamD (BamD/ComL family)
VLLRLDVDEKGMKRALRDFKTSINGGDEVVFFFAGHGVQLGTSNYLLPTDIHNENAEQVRDDSVALQRVLEDLEEQRARFSLAIIDACRDNPFRQKGRAIGGRGLAPTSPASGQMVIYSAGTGQQALDRLADNDPNPNGVFTRVFLREMEKPGVPVHQVLRNVRDTVVQLAKGVGKEQLPALYDQALGDFYFQVASLTPVQAPTPGAPTPGAATGQAQQPAVDPELELWERIKESRDMAAFEDFMRRFPNSRYTVWARASINLLREANENTAWESTRLADRREDYEIYLQLYPRGKYRDQASERIRQLKIRNEREAWDTADRDGTETAYQNYLEDYPGGAHAGAAKDRLNKLKIAAENIAWDTAKKGNRKEDYDDYLEQYPKGKNAEQARAALNRLAGQEKGQREKDAWDAAESEGTAAAFLKYLDEYPRGRYVAQARDRLKRIEQAAGAVDAMREREAWEAAEREGTDPAYQKYLEQFPKGKYAEQARAALKKLAGQESSQREKDAWDAAESEGTEPAFRKYLDEYPRGRYAAQARDRIKRIEQTASTVEAMREREAWEAAEREGTEPAYQKYLDAYSSGAHAGAARSRRDTWMQWRKVEASNDMAEVQAFFDRNRDGAPAILALALMRLKVLQDAEAVRAERGVWARAAAGDIGAVQDYLDRYPNGGNAAAARQRLAKLKAETAVFEEQDAWRRVAASPDMAAVQEYLDRYPNGSNVAAARERLRKLKLEAAVREEQEAWRKVETGSDMAAVQDFLVRYPAGAHAVAARVRLSKLRADAAIREEQEAWARADTTTDMSMVQGYLDRYPGGPHADAARRRLKELPGIVAVLDEDGSWNKAKASDEPAATEVYLARYPRGRHVVDAMDRLADILKRKMPQPPGTVLLDPFTDGSALGPELVVVASGSFEMGDSEGNEPEKPVHRVVITRPFAIGKYEISFDEWDACYADKGCEHNPSDEGPFMFNVKGRGKNPVINVSWDDVHQYMKWIGGKTGRRYRLLTEAEWEFAARGGTGTRYSFGNDVATLPKYGWSLGESKRQTHPVGELLPNPIGIYDIHGNVSEWVQDCMHSSYLGAPLDGSTAWTVDCVGDAVRVVRGGSALDASGNLRSAARTRFAQKTRNFTVGFRVGSDYP